jgi:hypothetical protein
VHVGGIPSIEALSISFNFIKSACKSALFWLRCDCLTGGWFFRGCQDVEVSTLFDTHFS